MASPSYSSQSFLLVVAPAHVTRHIAVPDRQSSTFDAPTALLPREDSSPFNHQQYQHLLERVHSGGAAPIVALLRQQQSREAYQLAVRTRTHAALALPVAGPGDHPGG